MGNYVEPVKVMGDLSSGTRAELGRFADLGQH